MARLKALVPIAPETTVLPEQFRLQAKTDAFLPAKRLMVAVLERALGEYETCAARTDWRGRRQLAEVEAWFASDDTGWPFSFVAICEALGLDILSVRAGLRIRHAGSTCGATCIGRDLSSRNTASASGQVSARLSAAQVLADRLRDVVLHFTPLLDAHEANPSSHRAGNASAELHEVRFPASLQTPAAAHPHVLPAMAERATSRGA